MKTRLAILMALFSGFLSAQVEMNYSYEMQYGNGLEDKTGEKYNYLENLLDINTYYGDNIYVYTQLEYSHPPVFGYSRTGLDSILSAFYIEYSHNRFNLKLGDLYELYGRGLVFYTLQDQNVDYDNSIQGLVLKMSLMENLEISTLVGMGDYAYRSNPAFRQTDYQIKTNVQLGSIGYETNLFGYLQFLYLNQQTQLNPENIKNIYNDDTEIGNELEEGERTPLLMKQFILLNQGEGISDTLTSKNYNLNWDYSIGGIDIYFDKAWIQYDKIYGDEVFGSRFYTSVYTELFETGITYEYKNYYSPYLIKSISNPPIGYREGNSILASRNAHSINFGNEIGHQIDLNRHLIGNINLAANLSLSHRHPMDDMKSIGLLDILSMKDEDEMYVYYPFRQIYLEMNGWALSDRLYCKVGMDYFTEFYDGKNTSALTIPTHWVWKLSSANSLTIYLETQKKNVKKITPGEYTNHYSSISYSHLGKWILTGFYDQEIKDSISNEWIGADLSYKLNSKTQISLFYGSQKGGLVCANGICAEQPGFNDGYKITFRSMF